MRINGTSSGPPEMKHRSPATPKRSNKSRNYNELKSFDSLKFVLLFVVCATLLTLIYSPLNHNKINSETSSYSSWIWDWPNEDPRYVSSSNVYWPQISKALDNLDAKDDPLKVGLLNFNRTESAHWQQLFSNADFTVINLKHTDNNITWDTLYPEWIDEEEAEEVPTCPSFPESTIPKHSQFDLVAVKLPCNKSSQWSRDVARLHLQIAAARLASASASAGRIGSVHVLIVSDCFPIPNLFRCRDVVVHEGNTWLYKPDLRVIKEKVELPVGSCQLAIPLKATARLYSETPKREAYATILHSANVYVCGAIAAAQSIRMVGSKRDLIILVDDTISDHHKKGLESAGWKVRKIQRIRNPKAEENAYNEWNYSKFRLWQLTDYDKIIFIDADLLILRNIDFLFTMPEISATGNNGSLFNSGVMVVEPSNCTFKLLMDHINEIQSYNGGDQGYLNEIFTWWHRIPNHINFLKHFWEGDEPERRVIKTHLFGADPPILYVLHYLGMKPWLCFRDYDCNWNSDIFQEFASDVAHEKWWKVHDAMPRKLQKFCLLASNQKASLEWDRRQAEKANFGDRHWERKIKDKRLRICGDEFCDWENMLEHWGETDFSWNQTSSTELPQPTANNSLPTL